MSIRVARGSRIAALSLLAAAAACSSSSKTVVSGPSTTTTAKSTTVATSAPAPATANHGVGQVNVTFTDASRSTAASGTVPAHPGRTLPTVVLYPAAGPGNGAVTMNAPPDRTGGPYPLIVFAHGFDSDGVEYRGLLTRWVTAGYVVAAPQFPLTHRGTPGGTNAGDYVNQPADVRFVITSVLGLSAANDGVLAALVAPQSIGAAGHSGGGITTLGLAANTCCHDARVTAAIVLSGTAQGFPNGRFQYSAAPPIMFMHGTDDPLVPYESSVDAFNAAQGPKGLVTVEGGGHASTVDPTDKAFASVVRITRDFWNTYLQGNTIAAGDITAAGVAGVTRVVFESARGSTVTVPTTVPPALPEHHASAEPTTNLIDGQSVTVRWSGFTPNKTVNVVQCSKSDSTEASPCDLEHGALLVPNPTGSGTAKIQIVVGKVGTGICDAAHSDCVIVVNDGGSLNPGASVRILITFAAG